MLIAQNQEESGYGFNNKFPKIKDHRQANHKTQENCKLEEYHAIRYEDYQTVALTDDKKYYQETDKNFATDIRAIAKLNDNFFLKLLEHRQKVALSDHYCEELHYEATMHREANIVNINTKEKFQKVNEAHQCKCGCQRKRGDYLPICCDLSELHALGPGIGLFFIFQKGIIVNLLIAATMFGIYTTIANLSGGNGPSTLDQCLPSDSKCNFVNNSSARNNLNDYLIKIEYLLGMILCIIWSFSLRLIRKFGHDKHNKISQSLMSSSDTAIQVTNLPFGQYCQQDLQEYFESLYQKQNKDWKKQKEFPLYETNFGMKSIQIVYNMQFCRLLITKIQQGCDQIIQLLVKSKQRDNLIPLDDYKQYRECKGNIIQTYQIMSNLRKKFLNDEEFRKKISTTCCIIEFSDIKYAKAVIERYGKDKIGFLKRIQYKLLKCCFPKAKNIVFHGKVLVIERAPEPSDLIWLNCQKQYSTCRMAGIFMITVAIIIVSFGLLLGLQYLNNYSSSSGVLGAASQAISLITTIALQIINKVLWLVLYLLLDLQYNYTVTDKIVSQMNKALLAICFNVLVLPFIVYVSIKDQFYGSQGLVGFVFDYHVTVITAGLALKFFDPISLIIRLGICIRPLRNSIFRFLRKDYDPNNDQLFKKRIYKLYEGEYFDVAEAYIFIMTNVYHAIFFCHLCPSILFFALAEVFIYYWINKVKLVRQFMVPQLTQKLVFDNALSQAYLVPIIYGFGSFFLSYEQNLSGQAQYLNYIFQMIVIGIGVISYINPGDIFNILTGKLVNCLTCQNKDSPTIQSRSNGQVFQVNDIVLHSGPLQPQGSEMETIKKTIDSKAQKTKKEQENSSKQSQQANDIVDRTETYFKNSNSLKLLGFEQVLKGKHENELKDELKAYCQGFLSRTEEIQQIAEDVKKMMINYLIPVEVAQKRCSKSEVEENSGKEINEPRA